MEEVLHESLKRYFGHLRLFGYQNYTTVDKIIVIDALYDALNDEQMAIMFTDCDIRSILNTLYKLYGSECIIPFPYHAF